jgi:hypothetical protein
MENWISILLSSAIIAAIVSGITTYLIEKRKFNQEYWKITIEKRLETYEQIEKVLAYFQSSHLSDDQPCHLAFLNKDSFNDIQANLALLSWKRNWISTEIFNKLVELNRLFFECNSAKADEGINNFGVKNYKKIGLLRDNILEYMKRDYLKMPKVRSFFKSKIGEKLD